MMTDEDLKLEILLTWFVQMQDTNRYEFVGFKSAAALCGFPGGGVRFALSKIAMTDEDLKQGVQRWTLYAKGRRFDSWVEFSELLTQGSPRATDFESRPFDPWARTILKYARVHYQNDD